MPHFYAFWKQAFRKKFSFKYKIWFYGNVKTILFIIFKIDLSPILKNKKCFFLNRFIFNYSFTEEIVYTLWEDKDGKKWETCKLLSSREKKMLNSLTRVRKPRKRIGREKDEGAAVTANVISGEKCGA